MNASPKNKKPPIVREYKIGGTRFVVKATVKNKANEDAADKIRRMIRADVARQKDVT